jgi:NAD(P)H-hydrate epimerase
MTLPSWLQPLPDAAQQRALDEWTIGKLGVAGLELMERAGTGLTRLVAELVPAGPLAVVCGKGNNGGDGLVTARLLREQGREVRVLLLGAAEELRGDARTNLERLPGTRPEPFCPQALAGTAGIVDAILGTGFSGSPREPAAGAIDAINAARAVVIACDVPSGVDASTGEVASRAVRAQATATFHAGKPGLWIAPGKTHAGAVTVVDIGIPQRGQVSPLVGLIDRSVIDLIPRRGADSTKFAAGSVLVCGGSTGLTGAPCLASESAMRTGAGYVTACVPASLNHIFEARLLEVMTAPLPDSDGALGRGAAGAVLDRVGRVQAMVLGPGLGRADETLELARELAQRVEVPLLLDADGLNAHAGRLADLAARSTPTVLTPHAGELARLLGSNSGEVEAHRLTSVREAAAVSGSVVVLKGDDTLVAEPEGRLGVSRGGAPALATAGTGDVLSGVIGALLAKRLDPFTAACAGVFVHAAAGRLAAARIGGEGVIASDVIASLPGGLTGVDQTGAAHPEPIG